jgi:hypothetical protein
LICPSCLGQILVRSRRLVADCGGRVADDARHGRFKVGLFVMQNRTIGPYSAANNRNIISVMWAAACTGRHGRFKVGLQGHRVHTTDRQADGQMGGRQTDGRTEGWTNGYIQREGSAAAPGFRV